MLAESDKTNGETINIGSGVEISIKDIAAKIKGIMGSGAEIISDEKRLRPAGSEVFRLCCDNSKIRKLTGFEPQFSIDAGLKKTVDWFLNAENLKLYKPDIYNV